MPLAAWLFITYLGLFLYFFHRLAHRLIPGLRPWQSAAIFLFRVATACCYGYIFLHYYGGDDTWNFFLDSIPETQKLLHRPGVFFQDLLPRAAFAEAHSFWQGMEFYLRNLEYWTFVKFLAIVNIFSDRNYYVDVLFFSLLTIWGPVLLLRVFLAEFPSKRNTLLLIIFFIPSVTFWLSGIRAEALLLVCMSLVLYATAQWRSGLRMLKFLLIGASFLGMIVLRVQFFGLFFPAYLCWLITLSSKRKSPAAFLIPYSLLALALVLALVFFPEPIARPLMKVQQNFMSLKGNTRLPLDSLQPGIGSWFRILPQAFSNTFLRPWFTEARGPLQLASAAELMAGWLLAALFLFIPARDRGHTWRRPLVLFLSIYAFSQILLIGFFVPFPGAIVRYKAIPELLLLITIGLSIDWKRIYYNKT